IRPLGDWHGGIDTKAGVSADRFKLTIKALDLGRRLCEGGAGKQQRKDDYSPAFHPPNALT
ncbi:hypothetical protein B4Q13_23420, partial [Lacticaseibacillus rhamnosus]